ncbi:hypothetical protein C8R42DRAFT_715601 [Lentinula raphanica]|nr:hypothetical protein C8R42DRAFT_715601 [Lentinula raphanica]
MRSLNVDEETYNALLKSYHEQKPLECLDHDLVGSPHTPSKKRPVKVPDHIQKGSPGSLFSTRMYQSLSPTLTTPPNNMSQSPGKFAIGSKDPRVIIGPTGNKRLIAAEQNSDSGSEIVPESDGVNDSEEDLQSNVHKSNFKQPSAPPRLSDSSRIMRTQKNAPKLVADTNSPSKKPPGRLLNRNVTGGLNAESTSSSFVEPPSLQRATQRQPGSLFPQGMDVERFVQIHIIKRKVSTLIQDQSISSSMQAKLQEITSDLEDMAASHLPDAGNRVEHNQQHQASASLPQVNKRLRFATPDHLESSEDELYTPKKKKQKVRDEDNNDVLNSPLVIQRVGLKKKMTPNT